MLYRKNKLGEELELPIFNHYYNISITALEFYLDLRKYGTVPHGGFGIGIERMVTFAAGTKHIREAIPFPRMLHRIKP